MNKKIIFFVVFVLSFVIGGFFLFLQTDILQKNPFLASVVGFKGAVVLSESDLISLKEKIIFLEKELETKKFDLEYLDDLIEENDLLSQRIIELKDEIQVLYESIFEYENNKEDEESNEELEEEDGEENEEKLQINLCEIIPGTLPIKNKVIINEVAWMGSLNSANDEWIELKNISGAEINLSGWQLQDKAQQIKIVFSEKDIISANGFYFLEKGSDQAVPDISADKIYTGVLSNENENLYFFDESCQLQDEAEANPNWPAGDNSSKRTMERKSDLAWQTSLNSGGTPKTENSSGYVAVSFVAASGGGGGTSTPAKIFYPKVLISEVQISPIGERFIELYNPNDTDVDLTGWYIQRKTGSAWNSLVSSTYFNRKFIPAEGYFLIARNAEFNPDIILSTLTLMENNAIVLKNPNKEEVDKVGWGQAPDFETVPFPKNPEIKDPIGDFFSGIGFEGSREPFPFTIYYQSVGRKIIEENNYQDTDNNAEDFEIQTPTPKIKNETFVEKKLEDVLKDIKDYYDIPAEVEIISGPDLLTDQTQATFIFQATKENCRFECRLDEQDWQECQPLKIYENLEDGQHVFSVRAIDLFLKIDPNPPEYSWTIEISSKGGGEETEPEPPPAPQNLLLNEFFDDGWEGTERSGNPVNWIWGKRGGLNLEISPLVPGKKSFYHEPYSSAYYLEQLGKELEAGKTYYVEVWAKGTGKVKSGIETAGGTIKESTTYTNLINADWTKITYFHTVSLGEETANGGIAVKLLRYDATGERLIIGAAWFGAAEPPENWPL